MGAGQSATATGIIPAATPKTKPSNGLGLRWVNPRLSLGWAGFIRPGSLNSFPGPGLRGPGPGHPTNPMNVSPRFLAFDRPFLFVSPGK